MNSRLISSQSLYSLIHGALTIVALATALGITFNCIKKEGIPLIRKPLRETREHTTASDLLLANKSKDTIGASSEVVSKRTFKAKQFARPLPNLSASKSRTKSTFTIAERVSLTQKSSLDEQTLASQLEKTKQAKALFINLADAKALYDKNVAVFVDSRLPIDYEAEHIPGSVNIFCDDVDERYAEVLGKIPKDTVIITYCSDPECMESIKLADALVAKGFTRVVILLDGLPGWKDVGYPTVKDNNKNR